jgi:dTDP-4-dehydrorhamnose 3,5-epimerase-like enzyme
MVSREGYTITTASYQVAPRAGVKTLHCTLGVLLDAIVDLRRDSPAFGQKTVYYRALHRPT